jgi:hypothetical protein
MKVRNFGIVENKIGLIYDTLIGNDGVSITDLHPLELETEIYEAECLYHYLVFGVRFVVWRVSDHYYIVNTTERTYISAGGFVTLDELEYILDIDSLGR